MAELMALERLLRRDRAIVAVGLVVVVALAWAYLAAGAVMEPDMADMDMDMVMPMPWSASYAALVFVMWWVMMIAMMVPSAAPTVLLFAALKRKQASPGRPSLEAWLFLAGYLLTWAGFSLAAVLVQWELERSELLTMRMATASAALGGFILLAAGLYQLTPIKNACLRHCQNPLLFLSRYWRTGAMGALRIGARHGCYCLGCCWFLMALLFVSGIMNLAWIAGIALYVACEKLLPFGRRLSQAAGVGLIVTGAVVLARAT
jgi:predicted metal-binding membrane protein